MRFLHIADLHIGKRVNGMQLVDDQRHVLAQIVDAARERHVDAVLIAGDIYDKNSPSAEAVTILDRFLTELAGLGVRVLGVPGNHDSAERIAYAEELLAAQGVCFPPVFDGSVACVELADEHGPVNVWLMPFLRPSDVRRFFPDASIGDDYAAALRAALDACQIDASQRNVAVSHQFVTAGGTEPERADDEIKLGGIDAVDVSVYEAFDYVALGHVHRPQRVGRDTVRYAGSPLKYSFSEARYDKSMVLVELGEKKPDDAAGACASFELVPLEPLHDMREVRMTLAELLALGLGKNGQADEGVGIDSAEDGEAIVGAVAEDATDVSASEECMAGDAPTDPAAYAASVCDFTEDYLHITLTDAHPQMDAMQKIRAVFPNVMMVDYDNAAILDARTHARVAVDPDKLDTLQLFAQFYEEQAGEPMDEAQRAFVQAAIRDIEGGAVR